MWPHPLQVISSRVKPYLLREQAALAPFSRISGAGWFSGSDLHCTARTPQTLHRRLFLAPHCTLRLSHLSVGGNTKRLEIVGNSTCRSRALGTIGADCSRVARATTPGPPPQPHGWWGWGLKYRDSQIFVKGLACAELPRGVEFGAL